MSALYPAQALLKANERWAKAVAAADANFFPASALGQSPQFLWIGCADSRVPETVITGGRPGDIFVHRNIANQFHSGDDSAHAVLAYALDDLKVEHVIVAGHTRCGGVAAAYAASCNPSVESKPESDTPLSRWLLPIVRLSIELGLPSQGLPPPAAVEVLVRENVVRQVAHVCDADPVQHAWAAGRAIQVHGWVYDLATGRITDLGVSRGPGVKGSEA